MSTATVTRGICAVCQHDSDCTYLRDFDHPPLQCEQFEMFLPTPDVASLRTVSKPKRMEGIRSPKDSPPPRSLGLCSSCIHQASCTYSKPEGGVWHCEEYQ
jgi:hypothetical protein